MSMGVGAAAGTAAGVWREMDLIVDAGMWAYLQASVSCGVGACGTRAFTHSPAPIPPTTH